MKRVSPFFCFSSEDSCSELCISVWGSVYSEHFTGLLGRDYLDGLPLGVLVYRYWLGGIASWLIVMFPILPSSLKYVYGAFV